MTTRAIKKLTKQDDIKKLQIALNNDKQDSDLDESDKDNSFIPINKFNLVSQLSV